MSNSTDLRPEATMVSLGDFFSQNEYSVPNYQRDYAWKPRQVEDLLTDLFQFSLSGDDYYVLGQVITSSPSNKRSTTKSLVDGQQRTTTIYLVLLALHRHVSSFAADEEELESLKGILQTIETILWRFDGTSPKKKTRFTGVKNGAATLEALVRGEQVEAPVSVSDKNLVKNLSFIERWLADQPQLTYPQGVWDFLTKMLNNVSVVNLELTNETQAIDFFVKLNSRGVKLNAADLLKGLILKNANDEDYEAAHNAWQEAAFKVSKVSPNGAASVEFLLGAMIRKRLGQRVSKDQLYFQWEQQILAKPRPFENIRLNKSLDRKMSVNEFVQLMTSDANYLQKIGNGETPKGLPASELRGTRLFKSFQHYNVLLAGAELNSDAYRELCRAVEARTILQLFSDEPSQEYEKILPSWAKRIGVLALTGSKATVQQVRDECVPAFAQAEKLLERVSPTLRRLRYQDDNGVSRQKDIQRIRYVLARTAQSTSSGELHKHPLGYFLETGQASEAEETAVPRHIDHIFPKSASYVSKNWPFEYPQDLIHSLGNLTLLWAEANQKASDSSPSKKREAYLSSEGLPITRSLALDVLSNNDSGAAGVLWRKAKVDLENWGPKDIELRTQLYVNEFIDDLRKSLLPFTKSK